MLNLAGIPSVSGQATEAVYPFLTSEKADLVDRADKDHSESISVGKVLDGGSAAEPDKDSALSRSEWIGPFRAMTP